MDFHTLTRRELQTLCKRNKIPANITNVAMADALAALEIVEGIEELLQPCESESVHSSIESPGKPEVTSPRMPPTGGRTTRRRNVPKEEPQTLQPMTRTSRTTRKTSAKGELKFEATETPAEGARTRRAPLASACRKMDSQFQECAEEEKKEVLDTPAPSGITSRRRRGVKEEGAVKTAYNTRRSARLAEKQISKVEIAKSEPLQKDLFIEGGENLVENLNENLNDSDEISGITGVEEIATVEEKSEDKDEPEVVSARKMDFTTNDKRESVEKEPSHDLGFGSGDLLEECAKPEDHCSENLVALQSKIDGVQEFDGCHAVDPSVQDTVVDVEELNAITEAGSGDKADYVESEGCNETYISKAEDAVFNNEQFNNEAGSEDTTADCALENEEGDFAELSSGPETCNDTDKEMNIDEASEVFPEPIVTEQLLNITDDVVHMDEKNIRADGPCGLVTLEDIFTDYGSLDSTSMNEDEAKTKLVVSDSAHDSEKQDVNRENEMVVDEEVELQQVTKEVSSGIEFVQLDVSAANAIAQPPPPLTPAKSSAMKTSAMKKRLPAMTDNKENIGSGSKLVIMKETVKIGDDNTEDIPKLGDLSLRKLCKMLKEKLEITNKHCKNEHGDEVRARPALQALPENRQMDENRC